MLTPGDLGFPEILSEVLSNERPDGRPFTVTVGSESESNATAMSSAFVKDSTGRSKSSVVSVASANVSARSNTSVSSAGVTNLAYSVTSSSPALKFAERLRQSAALSRTASPENSAVSASYAVYHPANTHPAFAVAFIAAVLPASTTADGLLATVTDFAAPSCGATTATVAQNAFKAEKRVTADKICFFILIYAP